MNKINFDKIPKSLKKIDQWVAWKFETRSSSDKLAKVPYDVKTNNRAKINDEVSYSSFIEVKKTYKKGGFDGVGFVLTKNDPLVGIDIDKCIINGEIDKATLTIIKRLSTYTEISPSGEGIRMFLKANLSNFGKRKGNIEIYNCDRYLTLTGNVYEKNFYIKRRQQEIDGIINEIFIEDIASKNKIFIDENTIEFSKKDIMKIAEQKYNKNEFKKQKFIKLFCDGVKVIPDNKSPSEYDLSLCYQLAEIFDGNFKYIENAFSQSALMRRKWNRDDYRETTIIKAISLYNENYGKISRDIAWNKVNFQEYISSGITSIKELSDTNEINEPLKILDPWLESSSIVYIYGKSGCGKTLFVLSLIKHIVCGKPFGPWNVVTPIKTLYYDAEMTVNQMKRYILPLNKLGIDLDELSIFSASLAQNNSRYVNQNIFDKNWQKMIEDFLVKNNYKLWVFDNIFSGTMDHDLNDARNFAGFNHWLSKLRNNGIGTILIDHSGKSKDGIFGSIRKIVPAEILLKLIPQQCKKDELISIKAKFEKKRIDLNNNSKLNISCSYRIKDGIGTWLFDEIEENLHEMLILDFIKQKITNQKLIADKIGISQPAVNKQITKLKGKKLVDGKGTNLIITNSGVGVLENSNFNTGCVFE